MQSSDGNDKFTSTENVDHTFDNGEDSCPLLYFELTFTNNPTHLMNNCIPSLLLDKGHFIVLQPSSLRGGYSARIQSDFIDSTNTCLMLFYKVFSYAVLKIFAQDEELHEYEVKGKLITIQVTKKHALITGFAYFRSTVHIFMKSIIQIMFGRLYTFLLELQESTASLLRLPETKWESVV